MQGAGRVQGFVLYRLRERFSLVVKKFVDFGAPTCTLHPPLFKFAPEMMTEEEQKQAGIE